MVPVFDGNGALPSSTMPPTSKRLNQCDNTTPVATRSLV